MRLNPDMAVRSIPRQSKYKNIKVEVDGEKFDSKKEAKRNAELLLLARAGKIENLQRQVVYVLLEGYVPPRGRKIPALRYVADHTYVENGDLVVEDTKSEITRKLPAYRIKRHMMAVLHGIHIREV